MTPGEPESSASNLETSSEKSGAKQASEVETKGTVVSVMQEHGMVTIDHAPVAALDWPSMTMSFVTKPDLLKGINKGDHVDITILVTPDSNDNYVLSDIQKMRMDKGAKQ